MPDEDEQPRAQGRALWSGVITFGLVSVPVDLFPANRARSVSLRMIDEEGTPLSRRYFCPEEDRPVDWDEIVRGYETEKEKYVVVTDEELDALEPEKSREIDLRRFVDLSEIDPMYFERAYFLAPASESNKAYRLLAEAMDRAGRAGIATFVMRGKEYLVALISEHKILRAETLRFHDELRSASSVGLPKLEKAEVKRVREMEQAIQKLSAKSFDRDEMSDDYAERLRKLVARKLKSGEDVVEVAEDVEDELSGGAEVIDIMEILKQRLEGQGRSVRASASSGGKASDLENRSKEDLYARAQKLDIPGRSSMTKKELVRAIRKAQ
ncbi:MAG: Ku protein [Gammaproteobacteria bacterium]|nr:Ku protein [Gammaproteobacteria bacterium]